jgi:hypothetical protein
MTLVACSSIARGAWAEQAYESYGHDPPLPTRYKASRALGRADRRLRIFNRGLWFREQNIGLNARKNSVNDAAESAEQPRAVSRGFSPWSWPPP